MPGRSLGKLEFHTSSQQAATKVRNQLNLMDKGGSLPLARTAQALSLTTPSFKGSTLKNPGIAFYYLFQVHYFSIFNGEAFRILDSLIYSVQLFLRLL